MELGGVPAKWALTFLVLIAFFLLLASFMSYLVTLEEEEDRIGFATIIGIFF